MQNVQRHFGRYMKRTSDEKLVSVLLKDFEDADQMLARIIDASKAWRESWISILTYQHRLCEEFQNLYAPIIGAGEDYHGHQAVETPKVMMARTTKITSEYDDLKRDLMAEVNMMDEKMIRPAQDTKDNLQLMRKTIKKREDKKLDYERYQNRVDSGMKKAKRSERDEAALVKAQADLARATESYNAADEHLRACLPRFLTVVFSLLPHLLAAQIQIQNALLAHYYTMLHNYCSDEGFPSPSPPMDEIIRVWDDTFKPIQQETESMFILANGKAIRSSMSIENGHSTNGYRRPSQQSTSFSRVASVSPARALPPSPSYDAQLKISPAPSFSATSLLSPHTTSAESTGVSPSPSLSAYQTPGMSFSPAAPNADYFQLNRDRQPSSTSLSQMSAISASIATKKKPPPPPPPRAPSQQFTYVTALYDFGGQGDGDLAFKEGDRIKVVKKTESTDDWWQGELRGVKGAFPANYCQ